MLLYITVFVLLIAGIRFTRWLGSTVLATVPQLLRYTAWIAVGACVACVLVSVVASTLFLAVLFPVRVETDW
jgi:hypothetical protein